MHACFWSFLLVDHRVPGGPTVDCCEVDFKETDYVYNRVRRLWPEASRSHQAWREASDLSGTEAPESELSASGHGQRFMVIILDADKSSERMKCSAFAGPSTWMYAAAEQRGPVRHSRLMACYVGRRPKQLRAVPCGHAKQGYHGLTVDLSRQTGL